MISSHTKAGLAAAKARGVKLGTNNLKRELVKEAGAKGVESIKQNADDFEIKVTPIIQAMKDQGKSYRAIAAELDKLEVKTARSGKGTARAVINVLARTSTH